MANTGKGPRGGKGPKKETRFALHFEDSTIAWMKFVVKDEKTVYVHGATGWATYVSRDMPREEARALWADLVKEGWKRAEFEDAPRDWWFWN